jgi:SAM-dependent MidA family methyltransferase
MTPVRIRGQTWQTAMQAALYGPGGFYRAEAPARHFRTSVHASPLFAAAVGTVLSEVDNALGRPARLDLVDVGAGRGELLRAVAAARPELSGRLVLTAVEQAPRPPGLPADLVWTTDVPELTGLLVANEWLDNVPLDAVVQTAAGPAVVLVGPDGTEAPGDPPGPADAAWLERWWPAPATGERAEIGRPRDEAWAAAVSRVRRGAAIAIDYGHDRTTRPAHGTLTGYRAGRQVPPVPDGSCDLTAHVALDSAAAAGAAVGHLGTARLTQREALVRLGVDGRRPPRELAAADPAGYLRALAAATQAVELTDPAGLGGFGWIVHAVGVPLPVG